MISVQYQLWWTPIAIVYPKFCTNLPQILYIFTKYTKKCLYCYFFHYYYFSFYFLTKVNLVCSWLHYDVCVHLLQPIPTKRKARYTNKNKPFGIAKCPVFICVFTYRGTRKKSYIHMLDQMTDKRGLGEFCLWPLKTVFAKIDEVKC